jgi:anti-sigma factor RsiW
MRCEDVLKQLTTFSSGELPADVRQAVQAHLAGCSACRAALAEADPLAGVFAGAETPPIPPGFASRVMAAARQRLQAGRRSASWNPLRWWRLTSTPMHAAAAAVLVIGLAIGLAMGWTAAPSPAEAETPAQPDPVTAYRIDYLGEAPSGSLADSYLTLVSMTEEGGR